MNNCWRQWIHSCLENITPAKDPKQCCGERVLLKAPDKNPQCSYQDLKENLTGSPKKDLLEDLRIVISADPSRMLGERAGETL